MGKASWCSGSVSGCSRFGKSPGKTLPSQSNLRNHPKQRFQIELGKYNYSESFPRFNLSRCITASTDFRFSSLDFLPPFGFSHPPSLLSPSPLPSPPHSLLFPSSSNVHPLKKGDFQPSRRNNQTEVTHECLRMKCVWRRMEHWTKPKMNF